MILKKSLKVGAPLAEALNLKDVVLEFDILPNRAHDCLSYLGLAREICAMEGRKLSSRASFPKIAFKPNSQKLAIKVTEKKLCPRYIGILMKNVKVGESPQWLKNRLIASGMEPINNVVDITNYVMLKVGNPLHAFDAEKIKKEEDSSSPREKYEIVVRRAKEGEFLKLLDETKIRLEKQDLVIANSTQPLALAGIKGGKDSGISANTKKIILEAANFDSFNIRKTRQRLGLATESQIRFEKEISPVLAEEAAKEAVFLLKKYAQAEIEEVVDANFSSFAAKIVWLDYRYLESLLGAKIKKQTVEKILKNLGFEAKGHSGKLQVSVPYWRLDVNSQEDLIEEIGRIYGYEKIPTAPLTAKVETPRENKERLFEWKIKDIFVGLGFFEVINYSFYGEKEKEKLAITGKHLELENPLSQDLSLLRKTLLPYLLANFSKNIRKEDEVALFEVGKVFSVFSTGDSFEKLRIGGVWGRRGQSAEKSLDEAKSAILGFFENLGASFNYKNGLLEFVRYQKNRQFDDSILEEKFSVLIKRKDNGEILGRLGQVASLAKSLYKIKEQPTVFEIEFEKLFSLFKEIESQKIFQKISSFPAAERDISFYLVQKTEIKTILKEIIKWGGELLEDVYCVENYLDPKRKKRSLTFRLVFRDKKKTLEGEKVNALLEIILQKLEQKKEIEIRKS